VLGYQYPDGRSARGIANPIRVPGVDLPRRAAPRMGEHTEALLREAGFDAAAIAKLRQLGVIADTTAPAASTHHPSGLAAVNAA